MALPLGPVRCRAFGQLSSPLVRLPSRISPLHSSRSRLLAFSDSHSGYVGQPLLHPPPKLRPLERGSLRSVACLAAGSALQNPFQEAGELTQAQQVLGKLSQPAQYALALGVTVLAAALGFLLGSRAPSSAHIARIAGAAAAAAVALLGIRALLAQRVGAAATAFKNALAVRSDPASFTREDLTHIGRQWGVDPSKALVQELKGAYDAFIQWVMPPPDAPLTGLEAERIAAFKDALGLADEDAAPVHLDVGRRILRLRYEASSAKSDVQQRKALQKLIYVSALVFGDRKAAFLLPWSRICDMSGATVAKAITDNARVLLQAELTKRANPLEASSQLLDDVKRLQTRLRASDESAAEALGEYARTNVEAALTRAIEVMQIRGQRRDVGPAIAEISRVINYCRDMEQLTTLPTAPPGIPKVTIYGGKLETKRRELADLFRMYIDEAIKDDQAVTEDLEDDIADLQLVLGLGAKEATDIVTAVTATAYRNLLREAVISGELDEAASPATVLNRICDQLSFDTEAAAALHKQLYRQKLESIIEPKLLPKTSELRPDQSISDDEEAELARLQRLLCVDASDAKQLDRDVLGSIFRKAVEDALAAGVDRFDAGDRVRVRSTQQALRMDVATAKDILEDVSRRAFLGFVSRARSKTGGQAGQQHAPAKELKGMVFFSNVCVAPLLEDIKAQGKESAQRSLADMMAKAQEAVAARAEGAPPATAVEAAAEAAANAELVEAAQKEVQETLAEATAMADAEVKAEASTSGAEAVAEQPKSLRKAQEAAAAEAASGQMLSQKEITLRNDLSLDDRLGIYRNFFIYCMTGHVTVLPMGATIVTERDSSEFSRLQQLGDILGLAQWEIAKVHNEFAERAYHEQVKSVVADGRLTEDRRKALEEVREQMQLPKEAADKIIASIANQKVSDSLQQLSRMGQLNLQSLLAIKESGQSIDSVPADTRTNLYSEGVKELLINGEGDFEEEEVRHQWPRALGLRERDVDRVLLQLAGKRKNDMLVQAIAHLRTKRLADCVKSLNNVVACSKALPSDAPMSWRDKAELSDLFSVYLGKTHDSTKQGILREALGITSAEAEALQDLVTAGDFHLERGQKEEAFF